MYLQLKCTQVTFNNLINQKLVTKKKAVLKKCNFSLISKSFPSVRKIYREIAVNTSITFSLVEMFVKFIFNIYS